MMKKIGCFIFFFSVFNFANAQVGVNTTSPKASLDIQINDAANPTSEDGILIPRIDTFPSSNPTTDQNAMLVYLTTAVGTNNPGFYYWDNATTTWIGLQKVGVISKIIDTDLDTKIEVEATTDEDIIRFTSAGVNGLNIVNNRIETTDAIGHTIKIGFEAGLNDDSNFRRNVFVGYRSGKDNTTGLGNNVIGFGALESNTTGTGNSALGYLTMNKNTVGKDNTAVGNRSLYNNTTGNHNLALGYGALISNTSANANIALGSFGLSALNAGSANISVGYQTFKSLVTGNNNIAIGSYAGELNTSGSNNTLLGYEAGKNATSASNNVLIGYRAGLSEMGNNKLYIENSGSTTPLIYGEFDTNLFRVNGTLDVNNAYQLPISDGTSGQALVTDGAGAVTWTNVNSETTKIIDADLDTQIQVEESADDDTIRFDIAGTEYFAMKNGRIHVLNTGQSVFIGENAGLNDDFTDNFNTAIGKSAMLTNTTGAGNTAVGRNALYNNNGDGATAVGMHALYNNTTGVNNTSVGFASSNNNTTGLQNTVLGAYALNNNATGSNNTIIGMNAGRNSTGSSNVFLGVAAGRDNTGSGNVFLGTTAGYSETGSNKLYIDNSNTTTPLVYGDFSSDLLQVNGTLNVNGAYQFPTTDGTIGQALVTDGAGAITWTDVNSDTTKIIDADLDTQIQVEELADEDTIRFDIAGTEYFTMKNGRIDVVNNGESVFMGEDAGANDDFTNNRNVAVGYNALKVNSVGSSNTAVGRSTLTNFTGSGSTALGANALSSSTSGANNTSLGSFSSVSSVLGHENTAVGSYAFNANTSGHQNTVIGMDSGRNSTGSNNVFLGYKSGRDATGSGNVFLGYTSGQNETGSNKLYIENSNSIAPLIYGEFDNDYLQVNGNFDVGVSGDGTIARSNAWNTFSDRRWKTNFKKIENALDKLNQINGYYYNWKDKKDQSLQVGVIAQEIEAVLPEIVNTDKNGYKSVDYSKISALLIQVAKEQQSILEHQETKIEELSKKYTDLAKEIENMKQLLASKKE